MAMSVQTAPRKKGRTIEDLRIDHSPSRTDGSVMQRIRQQLREGGTLGPLMVLVILITYALVSPQLPVAFHEYVYHILH